MQSVERSRWPVGATLGLLLVLAIHIAMRICGLFGPAAWRPLILASFLLLWPTPWLLLSADERRAIGFGRARSLEWWPIAAIAGGSAALLCFAIAWLRFGASAENPFISVHDSYLSGAVPAVGPLGLFLIFTGPALIFSPFGEEVFCRGVIFGRVNASGKNQASRALAGTLASATVFASIHLLHHGVTLTDGSVGFRVVSGTMWFVMMFLTSILFSSLRSAGGTIWLAIVAHSAFNLGMNAAIFAVFS